MELDKGPWLARPLSEQHPRWGVLSDDFTHDVTLAIIGDFEDDAQREAYARDLAAHLNTPSSAVDRPRALETLTGPAAALHDLFRENELPMSDRNAVLYDALYEAAAAGAAAKDLHREVLAAVEVLTAKDPAADTPEGKLLVHLASAVEEYEKKVFPMV